MKGVCLLRGIGRDSMILLKNNQRNSGRLHLKTKFEMFEVGQPTTKAGRQRRHDSTKRCGSISHKLEPTTNSSTQLKQWTVQCHCR
jgi:hypothetical protein